ncbi:MAG TPA: isochorismatase family protein [Candidatus Binatia bacterium]|nr:isochorismatase family protein [Candidatus Binatia bacterium]
MEGPNKPEAKPISLDIESTAVVVLDLSTRCHDPKECCSKLLEPIGEFLERVRTFGVPIIFTVSASAKGTSLAEVAPALKRRASEPVIYPDAFDKFTGGELHALLTKARAKSLVVVGSSTNIAVLYTCSTGARLYNYKIVLPLDGINTRTQYEHEYALHQFTVLPHDANKQFHFTNLSMVTFQTGA